MLATKWDFPVELRNLKTEDGLDVPHSRAVVRTDTNQPISVVSDRYRVITHRDFMNAAEPFIRELGKPEEHYWPSPSGARLGIELVFRNHQVPLAGKNTAALRLGLTNAYQVGFAATLQVSALVLECLNCAIFSEKNIFNLRVCHVGSALKLSFPQPEEVLQSFTLQKNIADRFGSVTLDLGRGQKFLEEEDTAAVLPDFTRKSIGDRWQKGYDAGERSAWDLLQHTTHEITHKSPKLSYIGRMQRLQKTARIFNTAFAGY